jgi:sulfatase modifying factor 1
MKTQYSSQLSLVFLYLFLVSLKSFSGSDFSIKNLDLVRGELTFTEIPEALSYRVERSKTLAQDSWSNGALGISRIQPIGPGDRIIKIGVIEPPCYYRVVAELAPPAPPGFVRIPGGSFQMGDTFDEGQLDEIPVHQVTVSEFYFQARETTKAEWDAVRTWALENKYYFESPGEGKQQHHPVHTVSWHDVLKWCNARSQKEGLVPCYYTEETRYEVYKTGRVNVNNQQVLWTANGYRLPTEAEWEKAARGGITGKRFPWGDTITHGLANYFSNSIDAYDISPTRRYHRTFAVGSTPYTSPVGSFSSNWYGLYDMAGNVCEWCWDMYGDAYYSSAATHDPRGPEAGSQRVMRGGCWPLNATYSRVADRYANTPTFKNNWYGFRPVRKI